jgi:hypothetical protein
MNARAALQTSRAYGRQTTEEEERDECVENVEYDYVDRCVRVAVGRPQQGGHQQRPPPRANTEMRNVTIADMNADLHQTRTSRMISTRKQYRTRRVHSCVAGTAAPPCRRHPWCRHCRPPSGRLADQY